MDRLGLVAATFSGLSFANLQELAREADSAGFEAILLPEFMNDERKQYEAGEDPTKP